MLRVSAGVMHGASARAGVHVGDVKLSCGVDFFSVEQFKGQTPDAASVGGLVNIGACMVNNSNTFVAPPPPTF